MKTLLFLPLLFSIFVSSANAQEGQHPRPDLLPGGDSISFTLRADTSPENVPETLRRRARMLRQAKQVRSIGKREGSVKEMFGEVADIAVTSIGQIYVVDRRYRQVRRYGHKDVPTLVMGGPGQGPKGFRDPTGLALFGDSVLAVLDRQRLSVMVYKIAAGEHQHRRTIRHGMPTVHMCSLGDRIVLQGVRPPRSQDAESERKALGDRPLLHVYGLAGTLNKSFGDAYASKDVGLSLQLSGGPVGCLEEEEMLVTALQGTPMLYGYRPSGPRAWITEIGNYRPVQVQKEGRATRYGCDGDCNEDVTRQITPLPTGEVLVQVIHRTPETLRGPKPWAHVATYLIAPETGEGVYVGKELPPIMEVHETRLYGAMSFPYPRVEVYEFGRSGSP
jgi:hypothetical protein